MSPFEIDITDPGESKERFSWAPAIEAIEVTGTMLIFEECVRKATGEIIFTFNRRSGAQANKNYKRWHLIHRRLEKSQVDPQAYFMGYVRWFWATNHRVPFVTQLGSQKSIDAAKRRMEQRDSQEDLQTHLLRSEIKRGETQLAELIEHHQGVKELSHHDIVRIFWPTFPPGWLAFCQTWVDMWHEGTVVVPTVSAEVIDQIWKFTRGRWDDFKSGVSL